MKYFNHNIVGIAMMCVTIMACTDKYDCNLQMEKPMDVANSEYLAKFDLLKSYITRNASSSFKLTTNISSTDFLKKDIKYSTILNNFDGIDFGRSFTPVSALKEDGSYNFSSMQLILDVAKDAAITICGGALSSNQGQPATYLNKLVSPTIIPFQREKGKTALFNFEDDELGAENKYPMTGNSKTIIENDPAGVSGKVLHVGTDGEKANSSFPKFHVRLPKGRKLGDYVSLVFDMRIVNSDGIYGAGMFVTINGTQYSVGTSAAGMGCSANTWSRGLVISLISEEAPGFILSKSLAEKTEFDLAFGSKSSGAQYYLDNITMNYETSSTGSTIIDFEKDDIGTQYPMTNGNQAVVENDPKSVSGKVLHIGTTDKLSAYSYPKFKVKLKDGMTLADYTSLSLDMYLIGGKGGWGSGIRVAINGKELNCGNGPFSFGCESDKWGRGLISIDFLRDGTDSGKGKIAIPHEWDALTEFELAIGSGSGEWHAYIDNISLNWKQDKDMIIEKTSDEKKAILSSELKKWIGGMVNVGSDHITIWDIISEPLDNTIDANTFKWNEYLGDLDYARSVVKIARDTAKVNLKLFVANTFNQYDEMGTLVDRLVSLVDEWEKDEKTTIDGYNIRLQAIYSENAILQSANKKKITDMLTKLAATGRAVRLSNLSVMFEDNSGNFIASNKISNAQRERAAEYLAFIIKQYRQLIDQKNQYGVSIASITDTKGSNILCPWTSGFGRTEIYEGLVNGLKEESKK